MMKRSLTILSLLLSSLVSGYAMPAPRLPMPPPEISTESPSKDALDALKEGREAKATELATALAEKGNTEAHMILAFILESQPIDLAKKSRYQSIAYHYRKASEAGNREATLRHQLSLFPFKKEKEREETVRQWEAAANQGDPLACRVMGEAYLKEGYVVDQPDPAKAIGWWNKAAQAGDARSMLFLGILHENGLGSLHPKNESEAITHYRKAADLGGKDAFIPLGLLLLGSDEAVGMEWLTKAAAAGDKRAWQLLADHKEKKGDPVTAATYDMQGAEAGAGASMMRIAKRLVKEGKNDEAKQWLVKAAQVGTPAASTALAKWILSAPSPDIASATKLLQDAAREGDPEGQYQLALLYLDGRLGWTDPKAAFTWMTEAMKGKDPEVYFRLAGLHEKAIGTPVNYANAGMLYTLASNKGHAEATAKIAYMAAEGLGTEPSPIQAWAYATLADERGANSAKALLAKLTLDEPSKAEAHKVLEKLR